MNTTETTAPATNTPARRQAAIGALVFLAGLMLFFSSRSTHMPAMEITGAVLAPLGLLLSARGVQNLSKAAAEE